MTASEQAGSGPAFEVANLQRIYDEGAASRAALDGVSLRIERGSFVAILGPSGSGKTTLLTILGALDRAYEGKVSVFGQDLASLSERALGRLRNDRLGFVFQSFHLLPHLTVLENVLVPSLFADGAQDARPAAQRALERVGLLSRADDKPQHLSGGQRQRVALARALLRSPEALLCDEPTGNLDSRTGAEIIDLLCSLQRDDGKTIVVVTHEDRLSMRASRRVEIVDGRLTTEGAA